MKEMNITQLWSIVKTRYGNAVLLKPVNLEIIVPIFVGAAELQAIMIANKQTKFSRPMTHELFINMLKNLNLEVKKMEIYKIENDIFHARLVITGGEFTNSNPLVLDSRPSDALALAIYTKCRIYIHSSVIEYAGLPIDFLFEKPEEPPKERYKSLYDQLEEAVSLEEYEQAAEIRDMIKKLNG